MVAEFPSYVATPEIRVEVTEESKFDIVRRAVAAFSRTHEVTTVDGARIQFEGGWGLLRASNTQPVLVLRYEAQSAPELDRIRSTMEDWLRQQGVSIGS
jgi:phosphomannomutase/phosphoglucomutase